MWKCEDNLNRVTVKLAAGLNFLKVEFVVKLKLVFIATNEKLYSQWLLQIF